MNCLVSHLSNINWLAVGVVTIVSFPLGALWHNKKLFGKAWAEDAKSSIDTSNKAAVIRLFSLTALFHFVAVIGLAIAIGNNTTALSGMETGFLISLAWISTSIGVTYMFVGRPFRLILIDAGFYILYFTIAGSILGAW
jgi:hypothetical protein